jgi:DNA-binding CsgD family transcriptional regulator
MRLERFLKLHPALNYAADLKAICAPLDLLDIVYFSHVHIDCQNNLSGLGIVPEFFELYFKKGYYNFDLHMSAPSHGEEYIIWDTVQRKQQSQSLHQDFMSFNQGHTFSIVVNHALGKECYHFATRLGNAKMNGEYLQLIDNLKKFILYFKEKIASHKELSLAYSLKMPLQMHQGGFITEETPLSIDEFNTSIQSNRLYTMDGDQYLTQREMECLSWSARGKTINETALLLDISARTVKAHMMAIKEKLGCVSQFQLGMYYSKLVLS